MNKYTLTTAACALGLIFAAGGPATAQGPNPITVGPNQITFDMVVSASAKACLPIARARVNVMSTGTAEDMTIYAAGLPANTGFDFFVIQVPKAPFGLSWYQGDVQTDDFGEAVQHFRGRFNIETFIVAPGSAPSPIIFNNAFPDVSPGPATGPVHTYHLGLWFNSPTDAMNVGCPGTVTPFNGEHNAGIQVLNTSNFDDDMGPLRFLKP
jgi:hypothetical protein